MAKYRKKPVVIEAVRWDGEDIGPLAEAFGDSLIKNAISALMLPDGKLVIRTLEGDMEASPGDWIIKGVMGELYPCKTDIFAATYEPVEE